MALESSVKKQRNTRGGVHDVQRLGAEVADNAIGQEHWRSFGLSPKSGQCDAHLFFNDQRKFGWIRLVPTIEIQNIDFFKKVGPEPLSNDFTSDHFIQRVRRRSSTNIKAVLLDQTIVAGIGNIYADESLWASKIHPGTPVKNLSDNKLKILFKEMRTILNLAIEEGGSTDKNYVNAKGEKGSYLTLARVFRRQGLPCLRCSATIEKTRVASRGTHLCPKCQKK